VDSTVTLVIHGPLSRTDLPGLLKRTRELLEGDRIEVLHCELESVSADTVALDALARLALAVRRQGCCLRLCGASEELRALVTFMGLAEVLLESP
jgi:ABC-type transporter Mla MlaB component